MEKGQQPLAAVPPVLPCWARPQGPRGLRRRGRFLRLAGFVCLLFIGYAQWTQLQQQQPPEQPKTATGSLSLEQLAQDLGTCAQLQQVPVDAAGFGRAKSARYLEGQPPVLIRNASVWVGEPVAGTRPEDARAGKGFGWVSADVLLVHGLIQGVSPLIGADAAALPPSTIEWDARGRPLTAGIIDMHSHAGVDSLPALRGTSDTNEMSSDITPYVRSIDGIQPQDHQIQVIKSGGVTTSLVLPGSGNNIGGEAYVIKHAVGPHDGRPELSIASLLAAPDAPGLRYIKMACGENAKRIYGKVGEHGPTSRLGESWEFRHAFEQAAALVQQQDDWCAAATAAGSLEAASRALTAYLPRSIRWDTLAAVLRGQVRVNTHCYTIPDLEAFVDHTNEFRFPVWAFHHAHQTYLVPEVLKRAWGADRLGPPASAMFATNMYYKAESYTASEFAGKLLYDSGLTPIYVSDNPVLNAQHVLLEAAKAYHYGLPYHAALAAVTTAPAERLGLGNRIGRVKAGFDADIVVWDSDPLSLGATPVQVWIDGRAQFDDPVELAKPAAAAIVPDPTLARKSTESPVAVPTDSDAVVVFSGIAKLLLPGFEVAAEAASAAAPDGLFRVAVSGGRIICVGACPSELEQASHSATSRVVALENGHVTAAFTAFGSFLGLNEIDAETTTDNGGSDGGNVFSRAVDGLALGSKKLAVAQRYGVTRAISAPRLGRTGFSHHGVSAGFLTTSHAATKLDAGIVFASDVAVHYTLGPAGLQGKTPSLSSAVGALRGKLLLAADASDASDYSEAAYLQKVVGGALPLVVTANSADAIAAVLQVKADVDAVSGAAVRLVILGGAESFLVADQLAAAGAGVVLAPLLSYRTTWQERRALTGAPLTNGTAVDALLDAGVVVAIGLEEDWLVRDLPLLAGIAYQNGGSRLSERAALDLISTNIYKMLHLDAAAAPADHFVVFEGSPLQIGHKIRAVATGQGNMHVME